MVTVLFGMVSQANAIPLTPLTYADSYYLGYINDGIPSNPAAEVGYINDLTTLGPGDGLTPIGTETYSRIGSTGNSFPPAVLTGAAKEEDGDTGFDNIFDATGFSYILGKYDARNAGSWVWYLGDGFIGDVELPSFFSGGQYGLSHISAYNPGTSVPEPATMFLLGTGLIGLALFGKQRFKK